MISPEIVLIGVKIDIRHILDNEGNLSVPDISLIQAVSFVSLRASGLREIERGREKEREREREREREMGKTERRKQRHLVLTLVIG